MNFNLGGGLGAPPKLKFIATISSTGHSIYLFTALCAWLNVGCFVEATRSVASIAIDGLVRMGCRGGTPGWGQSPHTPFDPSVLTFVATAIQNNCGLCN